MHFWLRAEVKELEKRTPLLPSHAKQLMDNGHTVTVERSTMRCISDKEYEEVGCKMVEEGSWVSASQDTIILGLKELPENNSPLTHRHIFFGHCYKNQAGWEILLQRFIKGNGTLLDIEFLVDDSGRRVAAFGRSAGFIGMALGIKSWCTQQLTGKPLGKVDYYASSEALIAEVKAELEEVYKKNQKKPSSIVIGALGRSGRGAIAFAEAVGITDIAKWDLEETRGGGPFPQILDYDIFINCILLTTPIPPFLNREMLTGPRRLGVVVDVSCDASNPHNPVPIYPTCTSFGAPVVRVYPEPAPVDVVAIDHLPSLVPLESSTEFSTAFISHLLECGNSPVWTRSDKLFKDKCSQALQALSNCN